MTSDGEAKVKKGAGPAARNKQIVLNYLGRLREVDRAAVNAALSQNFVYKRLNERFSRYEYLDSLERTLWSTPKRRMESLLVLSEANHVAVEIALEFEIEGREVRGQFFSVFTIEDGEIYELREYGGILE